jgi:hypothetical protein
VQHSVRCLDVRLHLAQALLETSELIGADTRGARALMGL